MERISLQELHMDSRADALRFLKRLWRQAETPCPLCGSPLEPLHKKAKKSDCDWQCRRCGKVFRTIHLLDELNALPPEEGEK